MTRSQLVFGLVFVTLGGLLLADEAGTVSAWAVIADWWPAVVILSGVAQLVTRPRNTVGSMVLIGIGGILLLWTLGQVATIGLVWPVLLIGLGVWLLLARTPGGGATGTILEVTAVFDDRRVSAPVGAVDGGSLTTVFGDLDLDLRQATIDAEGTTLQVTTIFGDVRLDVPDSWQVRVSGPELFGDVTLLRASEPGPDAPLLRLRVLTVFGDLTIRTISGLRSPHAATSLDGERT